MATLLTVLKYFMNDDVFENFEHMCDMWTTVLDIQLNCPGLVPYTVTFKKNTITCNRK